MSSQPTYNPRFVQFCRARGYYPGVVERFGAEFMAWGNERGREFAEQWAGCRMLSDVVMMGRSDAQAEYDKWLTEWVDRYLERAKDMIKSELEPKLLRETLATLLPALQWRRHGIGVLQAYVREAQNPNDDEYRVHIWHPALALPGIRESGNAHNHRFDFESLVRCGELQNTNWVLTENERGDHCLYDFVHARLHDDSNRSAMQRLPGRYRVAKWVDTFRAGMKYTFLRGEYHDSWSEVMTVTLVRKFNQADEKARVVAPAHKPPVPAFSGEPLAAEEIGKYVRAAQERLRAQ